MSGGRARAVNAPPHADADRVAAASAFIRERVKEADAGLLAIGNYLLDELFGGDLAAYAARSRKDASLRALLKHAGTLEVPITKTALSNALGMAVVARQLGEDSTFSRLPQSVAVELLPLRDADAIEGLAIDVDSYGMTVREVREVVRSRNVTTRSGRRPKPRLTRTLEALARGLGAGPSCRLELAPEDIEALSPEQREHARAVLGRVRDHLAALHEMLGATPTPSSDIGTAGGSGAADTCALDVTANPAAAYLMSIV